MSLVACLGRDTSLVSKMIDENPYSPPISNDPPPRPKPSLVGPILSGLIAIVLATIVTRGSTFFVAILGVGWWWVYKFWPRKAPPDDAGARKFLERLEQSPSIDDDAPKRVDQVSPEQPLDALRDLHL